MRRTKCCKAKRVKGWKGLIYIEKCGKCGAELREIGKLIYFGEKKHG
ncbi:MAG: hypothetical protein GY757_35240 [bacterium]|nr:hypothetical protein [bacterium]